MLPHQSLATNCLNLMVKKDKRRKITHVDSSSVCCAFGSDVDLDKVFDTSHAREIHFDDDMRLKPGPQTYLDRFKWSSFGWSECSPAGKDRLIRNVKILEADSHCTGICGKEKIIYHIVEEINCHIAEPIPHKKPRHTSESCDHRLQVLSSLDEKVRPHHIHMAVKQRHPEEIQKKVASLTPKGSDSAEVKESMLVEMKEVLRDFYESQAAEAFSAPCLCHPERKSCRLFSKDDDSEEEQTLTCLGVGLPCQDETTFGNKEGIIGKTRPTHLMIQEEFRYKKQTLSVWECADGWTPHELAEDNAETHTCEYCRVQGHKFGDAYHRDRTVGWLWDHRKVVAVALQMCSQLFSTSIGAVIICKMLSGCLGGAHG